MNNKVEIQVSDAEGTNRKYRIYEQGICPMFYIASFDSANQFELFLKRFNIKLRYDRTVTVEGKGTFKYYETSKIIKDSKPHFWHKNDVPKNALPIKALSNGSIVDCYYELSDYEVTFFRPNPNAKDIYKPLELSEHIAHQKIYGCY